MAVTVVVREEDGGEGAKRRRGECRRQLGRELENIGRGPLELEDWRRMRRRQRPLRSWDFPVSSGKGPHRHCGTISEVEVPRPGSKIPPEVFAFLIQVSPFIVSFEDLFFHHVYIRV